MMTFVSCLPVLPHASTPHHDNLFRSPLSNRLTVQPFQPFQPLRPFRPLSFTSHSTMSLSTAPAPRLERDRNSDNRNTDNQRPPAPPHISSADTLKAISTNTINNSTTTTTNITNITVIKVYSKGCRSCMRVERPYARLARQYADSIACWQLCADASESHQALAQSLGVRGFPTFVFYQGGKRVDHLASSCPDSLEQAIIDLL